MKGTITALVTPFKGQELDEEGLASNIRYQIVNGVNGILVLGSTGEVSTLSPEEQEKCIKIAVREAKGKVQVWVGTGSYCTKMTIEKTQKAQALGADVALIVTPYYNKPTQEGLYRHFEAISKAVQIPIMLYNIPGRCGTNIELGTLLKIAEFPNVMGVKESSGNIQQAGEFIHSISMKYPHFHVFSGDDAFTLPMMSLGAVGIVSVVSNLIPAAIVKQVNAALNGDFISAKEIHHQLLPLYNVAFVETNPVPIKTAMNLCGMPAGECRLPLYALSPNSLNLLKQKLHEMELIKQ
ncbi:MAG: 4-hydroxy-tetrahydrodipicolinate synthase [Parachlamydiaceae bacterium]|nr:4-hydroxy-tetrahydrodipicolinate synthase [Parachlamydiaceae bacterium]